jgi:hypothetical protein
MKKGLLKSLNKKNLKETKILCIVFCVKNLSEMEGFFVGSIQIS